jgi:hypothetical protein
MLQFANLTALRPRSSFPKLMSLILALRLSLTAKPLCSLKDASADPVSDINYKYNILLIFVDFDLEAIWEEHTYFEFEMRSVAKTMGTMVVCYYHLFLHRSCDSCS